MRAISLCSKFVSWFLLWIRADAGEFLSHSRQVREHLLSGRMTAAQDLSCSPIGLLQNFLCQNKVVDCGVVVGAIK